MTKLKNTARARKQSPTVRKLVVGVALSSIVAACGSGSPGDGSAKSTASQPAKETTVTLITHSAFVAPEGAFEGFTEQTGIKVKLVSANDAGAMVNQAILTRDHPQGDVLYGVDNTLLSRALDRELFQTEPFRAIELLRSEDRDRFGDTLRFVLPVDYGDVCVNYDTAWFADHDVDPPSRIADLTDSKYRDLTVVENPATSSPGLAFLLATRSVFGENWSQYWRDLRSNGVKIVDDWTTAYQNEFTAGGGEGERPIMVSYASSPPADVVYSEGTKQVPSFASLTRDCFRQYEFAGVLHGAAHPRAAAQLVEFLLSTEFQAGLPLSNFVFPIREGIDLPDVFTSFAAVADDPIELDADLTDDDRTAWIEEWTEIAL